MAFDLSQYETVESRLARFWEAFPEGRVETTLMNYDGDSCVFRAELYRHRDDAVPTSTGYAHEIRSERGVNATSFIENGETSSLGRACANFIFSTQGKRASRTEMEKVARAGADPQPNPVRVESNPTVATATDTFKSGGRSSPSPTNSFATVKQQTFMRALARGKGLTDDELVQFICATVNSADATVETLTGPQASKVIEQLKL
jgi:hypothetical protein